MIRDLLAGTAALSLLAGSIAPAFAQEAPPPGDRMARPPVAVPGRPQTRPAVPPQPGNGWGGSGGSWQGGNRPPEGWGGSGGSWQGNNRPPPGWQGDWNNDWNGGGWGGGTIRCESRDGRYRRCGADTRGGVRLVRNLSSTACRQGRNWGYRPSEIWVSGGCRGEFQLRYGGGGNWDGDRDDGPSTGAVIGGVAVAAGLIALLASGSKKGSETKAAAEALPPAGAPAPSAPPAYVPPAGSTGQPARINVPPGSVAGAAEPSFRTCLTEAARQIGATGGTEILLDRVTETTAGNGGYRFRFNLKGVYPDETRLIPTYCRATPSSVVELTFG